MERFSSRTIDEFNRITLHSEIRKLLSVQTGDKISLKIAYSLVVLQKLDGELEPDCFAYKINDLGMIEFPYELRQRLGWNTKDKVAIYLTGSMIILKLAEKN